MLFRIMPVRTRGCVDLKLAFRFFIQSSAFLFLAGIGQGQQAQTSVAAPLVLIANFTDVAEKAGLTMQEIFGGIETKKYIIETTGTGVAIFDYDNDGWPDIFLVNGTRLDW